MISPGTGLSAFRAHATIGCVDNDRSKFYVVSVCAAGIARPMIPLWAERITFGVVEGHML